MYTNSGPRCKTGNNKLSTAIDTHTPFNLKTLIKLDSDFRTKTLVS
jgi:hypothetical protein